ncbi:C-type lectin 37Db-like [Drosophila eugracilis]|uniref:C-type lectin 37Db-like n=1 Tax=Drosophila eugracilis TaxID=29029 RepID=UPI001BDAB6AF|nr:C-type lectin 37Db-like [Drosophila eugracilis]
MIGLVEVVFFAIIATSFDQSVANPGLQTACDESCVRTLQPMLDLIITRQTRMNNCEKNNLNERQIRIDAQLDDLHTKIAEFTSSYEKHGSRFFYIEKRKKENWFSAANICRKQGSYLANIRSAEELTLISTRLNQDSEYWLDINDLSKKEEYVSSSSGKLATFLDWHAGEPNATEVSETHCVSLLNGKMKTNLCKSKNYFICQAIDDVL